MIKQNKVLELNYDVSSVNANSEKNLLLVVAKSGEVSAYNVDHALDGVQYFII